jgi:DNA-binding response OmpR family regulator
MTDEGGRRVVLVVDDLAANRRLMQAILTPHGYEVVEAESGEHALELLSDGRVDLVLLDLVMPGLDGHETCRRIRANPDTAYLPVVMVTASGPAEKVRAIDAGADDFINKPLDQAELLGRVRSLLRIKRYHDTVVAQAAELASWNEELEARVAAQVERLERYGALRRFFSPQITRLLLDQGDDSFLTSHRREITAVFCDLRGFTAFAETSDPEEVMSVLAAYHRALGDLVFEYEGTLEHFAGDGLLVFFNDPRADPGRCGPGGAHGGADARGGYRAGRGVAPPGIRPRSGSRDLPGLRDIGTNRVRGTLRLRRHRHGDQPRGPVVCTGDRWTDSGKPARHGGGRPCRAGA